VPFLALVLARRGLTPDAVGLVVSLWGAGTMVAGLAGGVLADRLGRRATMVLSLMGGAVAMALLGLARDPWHLGALAFATGFMGEMYRPAVSALVADVVPPEDRQRAYGYLYWVINLGFAAAPVLAALVSQAGDLWLFVGDAITTFLYGIWVLLKVPETRPRLAPGAGRRAGMAEVSRDTLLLQFLGTLLLCALVMWQNGVALPLDMKRHGIDDLTYGLLMGINGVLIVVLQPVIAARAGRWPRAWALFWGCVLFGVGFGLNAVPGVVLIYAAGIALWTLGEIVILPMSATMVADMAPADLRGRYQGMYSMTWGIASTIGPTLGGLVMAGPGGTTLWLGCLGVMLACALGQLALGRKLAARLPGPPATAG
jgi:MFS family permease